MIYLDSSVLLARLFAETASPAETFWLQQFTSSRLLEYEVNTRINRRADRSALRDGAQDIIDRIFLIELSPAALARALAPFPVPVKTLDGLHLATMHYLCAHGQTVRLASYDKRLNAAAAAMGVESVADL